MKIISRKQDSSLPWPTPHERWIVVDSNGKSLGQIGANLSVEKRDQGYLGFFEVQLGRPDFKEISDLLFSTAVEWLRVHGARKIYGPVNYCTWFQYRYRVKPEDETGNRTSPEAAFSWEPENPPEYLDLFERAGFTPFEYFHSIGFKGKTESDVLDAIEITRLAYESAVSQGFRFRPLNREHLIEQELPLLHEMSMKGFKDNSLFEPIPFSAFAAMYASIAQRVDFSLTQFAMSPEGKEVGFLFAFPDRGYSVMKSVTILPEFRKMKLSSALVHLVLKETHRRGMSQAISALVRLGSSSEYHEQRHLETGAGEWRHDYVLFEKNL